MNQTVIITKVQKYMKSIKKIINCENTWPFSSYAKKYKRYENRINYDQVFKKPFIFVTGTPRSGTSLITKIIDAHPDIAMIMENIFGNRRRHWQRASFWEDHNALRHVVYEFYKKFQEPILGNKVCTPDIWSADDIVQFCSLFENFKIVFVVRDPRSVVISRYIRENFSEEFNQQAINRLNIDFSSRTSVYLSSWNESINTYFYLKKRYKEKIFAFVYDDFFETVHTTLKRLFEFINVEFQEEIKNWHKIKHYNASGELVHNLKYNDEPLQYRPCDEDQLPLDYHEVLSRYSRNIRFFELRHVKKSS